MLFERTAELEALEGALAAAGGGAGRMLVVEGAAGTGKSELIASAERHAQALGLQIRVARGGQLEQAAPFGVATELFGGRVPAGTDSDQGRLVRDLFWSLADLAGQAPLLVTVDDAHWCDPPSLRFLVYLAERIGRLPVALVLALDPAEATGGHWAMRRLRSLPDARVLRTGPLSAGGVADMTRRLYFPDADDDFCRAVGEATGGNPFVVREILRLTDLEGLPPTAASADRVRGMVPDTLMRAVRERLARIHPEAGPLADAASVLGPDASLRLVSRLADLDFETAMQAADALVAGVIVAGLEPVEFTEPAVRSAVYRSIPPGRRSLLHHQAVALLADEGAGPERLAPHLVAAVPAADPEVSKTLRTAARWAVAGGDRAVALRYLRRALAEPPPTSRVPGILFELGRVEATVGEAAAVDHLRRAVETDPDPHARGEAVYEVGRALVRGGRPEEATVYLDRAIEAADVPAPADLRLRLLATQLQATRLSGSRDRGLVAAAEAVVGDDVAFGPGKETAEAAEPFLVGQLAMEWLLAGRPFDEVRAAANRAVAGMESAGAGEAGLFFYDAIGALAWADDLNGAEAALDRAVTRADECGLVLDAAAARFRRAMVLYLQGSLAGAVDDARAAIAAADFGWTVHLSAALGVLALALIELGELDPAAEALDRAERLESPAVIPEAISLHARATLYLVRGDPAAAAAEAIAAGQILTQSLGSLTPLVPWRSLAAAAHHQLGAVAEARRMAVEEVQMARAFGAPRSLGVALRAHGSILGGAEGTALLREATDVLAVSPARLEYARALGELGAALRRGGHGDATAILHRALELAEGCGAVLLAGRVADELRAGKVRVMRRTAGVATLTPAQERVARLAATGLTNKQIAAQLYVGVAAVEFHLRNVFRKLGISSRRELSGTLPPED